MAAGARNHPELMDGPRRTPGCQLPSSPTSREAASRPITHQSPEPGFAGGRAAGGWERPDPVPSPSLWKDGPLVPEASLLLGVFPLWWWPSGVTEHPEKTVKGECMLGARGVLSGLLLSWECRRHPQGQGWGAPDSVLLPTPCCWLLCDPECPPGALPGRTPKDAGIPQGQVGSSPFTVAQARWGQWRPSPPGAAQGSEGQPVLGCLQASAGWAVSKPPGRPGLEGPSRKSRTGAGEEGCGRPRMRCLPPMFWPDLLETVRPGPPVPLPHIVLVSHLQMVPGCCTNSPVLGQRRLQINGLEVNVSSLRPLPTPSRRAF